MDCRRLRQLARAHNLAAHPTSSVAVYSELFSTGYKRSVRLDEVYVRCGIELRGHAMPKVCLPSRHKYLLAYEARNGRLVQKPLVLVVFVSAGRQRQRCSGQARWRVGQAPQIGTDRFARAPQTQTHCMVIESNRSRDRHYTTERKACALQMSGRRRQQILMGCNLQSPVDGRLLVQAHPQPDLPRYRRPFVVRIIPDVVALHLMFVPHDRPVVISKEPPKR